MSECRTRALTRTDLDTHGDSSLTQVDRFKRSHTFMVAELFAETQPCPQSRLISAWELLKESFETYRTNCNEWQPDIKRLMKHSKLLTKK